MTAKTRVSVEVAVKHRSTVTSPEFLHRYFLGVNHEPAGASGTGVCVGSKRGYHRSWGILPRWVGHNQAPLGFRRHCAPYLLGKFGSQGPLQFPQHQGLGQRLAAWLSGGKISYSRLFLPVLSHRLFPEECALQDGRMVHSWETLLFKGLCLLVCVCYACVLIYVCMDARH